MNKKDFRKNIYYSRRLGRPPLRRRVSSDLRSDYFKPQGVPMRNLEIVELSAEEIEALRLKNIRDLEQKECARKMNTSQSTFQRILSSAYKKVSQALSEGKGIKISREK